MRLLVFLSLSFPTYLLAAAGAPGEIPTKFVITQSINLALAIGILIYFTRKAVVAHFKSRHDEYHAEVRKAEEAKKEAETKKREISERLNKLKNNQEQSLSKAKSEAQALKNKIISDAKTLSQKMEDEALKTSKFEHQRAIEHLRQELLERSLDMAQEKMKDEVDGADLKRMRMEFVDKIQVVR